VIAIRFTAELREVSLRLHVHNFSGAHPGSSSVDKGSFLVAVERPALEADHTPSKFELVLPLPICLKTSQRTLVKQ